MKKCPKCGQTYADKDLNFCYNDGELLTFISDDTAGSGSFSPDPKYADEPPTAFMGAARVTSETNWPPQAQAPPAVWQGNQAAAQMPFSQYPTQVSPSQALAVVSLGLGVGAITIGWCCYSGLLLSPAAIITGIIALVQTKSNPKSYGGRGFAIAGIVTASVFLVLLLLVIILTGIASLI